MKVFVARERMLRAFTQWNLRG